MDKVRELKDRRHHELINELIIEKSKVSFPNLIKPYGQTYVAVQIEPIDGKPVVVYIDEQDRQLFCQVEFHYGYLPKEDRMIKEVN